MSSGWTRATNLLKGYDGIRVKLEDTTEFFRKGDLVRVHTPREAAGRTEMLAFSEQRFTAPKRCFSPRMFDGDAREVRRMRDEILMMRRRFRRIALDRCKTCQGRALALSRLAYSRPISAHAPEHGSEQRRRTNAGPTLCPPRSTWIFSWAAIPQGNSVAADGQPGNRVAVAGRKRGLQPVFECPASPIDQVNAAIAARARPLRSSCTVY